MMSKIDNLVTHTLQLQNDLNDMKSQLAATSAENKLLRQELEQLQQPQKSLGATVESEQSELPIKSSVPEKDPQLSPPASLSDSSSQNLYTDLEAMPQAASLKRKLLPDSPILAAQHLPATDGSIAGARKSALPPSTGKNAFKRTQ